MLPIHVVIRDFNSAFKSQIVAWLSLTSIRVDKLAIPKVICTEDITFMCTPTSHKVAHASRHTTTLGTALPPEKNLEGQTRPAPDLRNTQIRETVTTTQCNHPNICSLQNVCSAMLTSQNALHKGSRARQKTTSSERQKMLTVDHREEHTMLMNQQAITALNFTPALRQQDLAQFGKHVSSKTLGYSLITKIVTSIEST